VLGCVLALLVTIGRVALGLNMAFATACSSAPYQ
jgi:hypothetical protein